MSKYMVNLRGFAPIKTCAKQLDGKIYNFTKGWVIDDHDLYEGETAMIPRDDKYPEFAPTWIASGDLELVK